MKETNKSQNAQAHLSIATQNNPKGERTMKIQSEQITIHSEATTYSSIAAQNQKKKEGKTMKTRKTSLRRVFASALAVTTAAAIVIAGTYGWSAISQIAKGTADGTTQNGGGENQTGPGGRLHFDFDRDSGAAEVYAENFGTEPLFVRARLNVTTDLTDSEVTYTYGGDKIFMPTFLKDSTKLYSDVTGDAIDPLRETAPVPEYPDYTENETKTDTAYYTDQTNALATHKAKSTIVGAAPIAIADWDGDPVDRWFIDADGWYYWGAPLEAGEATSLLLNAIEFKADRDDWEFVILPEAEFVDIADANMFAGISDEAKELLGTITELRGILGAIGIADLITVADLNTNNIPFWPANGTDSGEILKRQVLTVTVVNEIDLTDAVYSWDVSALGDGLVMAWYTVAEGKTNTQGQQMYDLFLGAEGGVKTGTRASGLFANFNNAVAIDVSKLDTSRATSMYAMFYYCGSLESIEGLNSLDTSNVTNMGSMFRFSPKLTSLDLSGWDTSKVTNMINIFTVNAAGALEYIDMRDADFSALVPLSTGRYAMFDGGSNLMMTSGVMIVKDDAARDFIIADTTLSNGSYIGPANIYTLAEWQALGNP